MVCYITTSLKQIIPFIFTTFSSNYPSRKCRRSFIPSSIRRHVSLPLSWVLQATSFGLPIGGRLVPISDSCLQYLIDCSLEFSGMGGPEEKRHAMSLFTHWRPPGHLPISEDYRLTMVRQQAMAWLLRRYFDGLITEEKA